MNKINLTQALKARLLSEKVFIEQKFKKATGRDLNLKYPKSFSEKIQWLKLYYRNPLQTKLADKYEAKKVIAGIIGEDFIIPNHKVYNVASEIKVKDLQKSYILKTTHGSGKNLLCKESDCHSESYIQAYFKKWLNKSYYLHSKEWAYKNIKPRVICEKLIFDKNNNLPNDFKFFCFHGVPKYVQVDHDRFSNHTRSIYDENWKKLDFGIQEDIPEITIEKPINFDMMKIIAAKISKDFPFVRVDLYNVDGIIYFGEVTFYPGAGFQEFSKYSWDLKFGELINLPI